MRIALFAATLLAASLTVKAETEKIVPGGPPFFTENFAAFSDDGKLEGWEVTNEGSLGRVEEEGKSFLRFVAEQPNQYVSVSRLVPIPPGVKGVVFTSNFRVTNFSFGKNFLCDPRTRFGFVGADGEKVGKEPGDMIFNNGTKGQWGERSREFLVPEGAVSLKVNVCLNRPKTATLDVLDIALAPMEQNKAEALALAPLLAAKKKAEDEAEVTKMLELPPITPAIRVSGNQLVTDAGKPVHLQGVNVPSMEWSPKGESVLRSVKIAIQEWKANAIRLPVSGEFWFGRGGKKQPPNDSEAYRKLVDDVVRMAAGQGAYVILDLHYYGGPKENAVEFWKDAATHFKNNPAVLFDLFNEPHGLTWELWQKGGPKEVIDKKTKEVKEVVQVIGMQTLVDTVRATGAKNIIVAGGMSYAFDLSGVLNGFALTDPGGNGIMYATHFYNWHKGWETKVLPVAEKYPVLVGEFGADVKKMSFIPGKQQESPSTWVPDALGFVQKYGLNWTAFSFHPKATPVLLKNWDYEPTSFWGEPVKEALGGKQFEMKKMR